MVLSKINKEINYQESEIIDDNDDFLLKQYTHKDTSSKKKNK